MILRGHHLLCIQAFQGKGYDEEFVSNMQKIYDEWHQGVNPWFLLVVNQDDICQKCPNMKEYGCISDKDGDYATKERDRRVIKFLGMQSSLYYPVARINQLVQARVKAEDLVHLCQECRWMDLCKSHWQRAELDKGEKGKL